MARLKWAIYGWLTASLKWQRNGSPEVGHLRLAHGKPWMAVKWLALRGPFTAGSWQALNGRQMATLKRAICDKKWLAMLPFLPFVALTETTNGPFMSCLLGMYYIRWQGIPFQYSPGKKGKFVWILIGSKSSIFNMNRQCLCCGRRKYVNRHCLGGTNNHCSTASVQCVWYNVGVA